MKETQYESFKLYSEEEENCCEEITKVGWRYIKLHCHSYIELCVVTKSNTELHSHIYIKLHRVPLSYVESHLEVGVPCLPLVPSHTNFCEI